MNCIEEYYNNFNEDERLSPRHNSIEYLTTMHYIEKYLPPNAKILEIGAGTGRYSIALADRGYDVTAVELIQHNIDVMKSKVKPNHNIKIHKGNAVNLPFLKSNSYDIVLLLGPMYHLFNDTDKHNALKEAIRVAKKNSVIYIAYCNNDSPMYRRFVNGTIMDVMCEIDENFHYKHTDTSIFENYRKEEIDELMAEYDVEKLHYVGTDMLAPFFSEQFDNMSDEIFELYMKYHYQICEKPDMLGFSFHMLDIFRKK